MPGMRLAALELGVVRVQLDLVDGGYDVGALQQRFQIVGCEVADTDRPHLAVGQERLGVAVWPSPRTWSTARLWNCRKAACSPAIMMFSSLRGSPIRAVWFDVPSRSICRGRSSNNPPKPIRNFTGSLGS